MKDGKPITGLEVQFIPLDEVVPKGTPEYSLPGGTGILRLDGSYTVYQHKGPVGLKAGRYAVTFAPTADFIIGDRKRDNPVPEKYRDAKTTPYKIEVKKDVRNRFDFKLDGERSALESTFQRPEKRYIISGFSSLERINGQEETGTFGK